MNPIGVKNKNPEENYYIQSLNESFREKYIRMWWETGTGLPQMGMLTDKRAKVQKEKGTDKFVKDMVRHFKVFPDSEFERKEWNAGILKKVRVYAKDILGFKEEYLNIIFSDGFVDSTSSFIREAKSFAPSMKIEDIFQAIRNVWIMNSIQVFLNKKVGFSHSVFSYSMLYPYTDNYLDSNEVTYDEKRDISDRFRMRLADKNVEPCSPYEKELFDLVERIESEYPRLRYPKVYESLLGIHDAQQNSLMQQMKKSSPYERDILGISFEKGGMSVLTDAYLVKGDLDAGEAEFMFGFGVLLQLADDLQDVNSDMKNGHMTIFSQIAEKWPLDNITNRLLNFVEDVMDSGVYFESSTSYHLKELIKYNCNFLIIQAIAKNRKLYTKEYIKKIENYSLFRFPYMKRLYSKLQREYAAFERNKKVLSIDEMIYASIAN